MTAVPYNITYGQEKIAFDVFFSRRKTLQIAVFPDGRVVVNAPAGTDLDEIKKRVRNRGRWIRSKQGYFQQFRPRTPPRHYVSGETHLYLGLAHK